MPAPYGFPTSAEDYRFAQIALTKSKDADDSSCGYWYIFCLQICTWVDATYYDTLGEDIDGVLMLTRNPNLKPG